MIPVKAHAEKRRYQRKTCAFSIHIEDDRRSYLAYLRDLSLGGALVEPPLHFNPRVGQELRLTIPFLKRPGVVVVNCKILQARKNGVAVAFLRQPAPRF